MLVMLGEPPSLTHRSINVPIEKRVSKEHFLNNQEEQEQDETKTMVCICTTGMLNKTGHPYLIDGCLGETNTVCVTSVEENKRNGPDSLH